MVNWLPVFSHPQLAQIVLDSLRFLQAEDRLTLHGYVILENHLHLIASGDQLAKEIGKFKSFTARSIIDRLHEQPKANLLQQLKAAKLSHKTGQRYQLWQEGSHPQALTSPEIAQQKLEYIHNNPVARGYVDEPGHWRYSSYRNYSGQQGLIDINPLEL
nr:transposase [Leptolyngbya sp. KIOST-1]